MTVWEFETVYLFLNVCLFDSWVSLETSHVNFVIEMSDVSDDGIVLHLRHILNHNNLIVSSGSDKNIRGFDDT